MPAARHRFSIAGAMLLVACGGEAVLAPGSQSAFSYLELSPSEAQVVLALPGNTVQVSVVARDAAGRPLALPGPVTYWSADTSVAKVDQQGLVTAFRPGSALIRATATLGGATRTAVMLVTAVPPPHNGVPLGTYDLSGVLNAVDNVWGSYHAVGDRYTSVLTFGVAGDVFSDLRRVPVGGGTQVLADQGEVVHQMVSLSTVRIRLFNASGLFILELLVDSQAPGILSGQFSVLDGVYGEFEARRR